MKIIKLFFALIIFLSTELFGQAKDRTENPVNSRGFFENKGQITDQNSQPNPDVKYLFCSPGFNVQLRQTGFSYDTYTNERAYSKTVNYHRVDVELKGCNPSAPIIAEGPSESSYNYFLGGICSQGITHVHYYEQVTYKNIYPNIDLAFYTVLQKANFSSSSDEKHVCIEYNFIIHPGGKASDIQLAYQGANTLTLQKDTLRVIVASGEFTENIPVSYTKQNNEIVEVHYSSVGNNIFSFSVPHEYDTNSDLIIDPAPCLWWATYYGNSAGSASQSNAIAVDADHHVFISGSTTSASNIASTGAYQSTYTGQQDAFAAEFDSSGTALVWATYYGGDDITNSSAICIDANDHVFIAGLTQATNLPTTSNAFSTSFYTATALFEAYIAEFTDSGSTLWLGTYYANAVTFSNAINDMAISKTDPSGGLDTIYICGFANRSDTGFGGIPLTAGAFHSVYYDCETEAWAAALSVNQTSQAPISLPLWSTWCGGGNGYSISTCAFPYDGRSNASGIALDNSSPPYVYITGFTNYGGTNGEGYMCTPGAYMTAASGNPLAFVQKYNPWASGAGQLVWGTLYGGTGITIGFGIAVDTSDNVFISGLTNSTTGIASATGAIYNTLTGTENAFVAEFNSTGSGLLWGTYYGSGITGTDYDPAFINTQYGGTGHNIALSAGASDTVYIAGTTTGVANIATPDAYQSSLVGTQDAFIAKISVNGANSALQWGTYYGGGNQDVTAALALSADNILYITGGTSSDTAISTPGTYQTTFSGTSDAYVASFACISACDLSSVSLVAAKDSICAGDSVMLTASPVGSVSVQYNWSPGGQTTQSVLISPDTTTSYTVTVKDTIGGCFQSNFATITVHQLPVINTGTNANICPNDSAQLNITGPPAGSTYIWFPSTDLSCDTCANPTARPLATVTYTISVTNPSGCTSQDTVSVIVTPLSPIAGPDTAVCAGSAFQLYASGGTNYLWAPSTGLSDTIVANPGIISLATTTYIVTVSKGSCSATATVSVTALSDPPTPIITQSGDTLKCNTDTSYTSYQWYADSALVPGATKSYYIATQNGNYNVQVTGENGCSIAAGINVVLGIPQYSGTVDGLQFTVSPNPVENKLTVSSQQLAGEKTTIEIYSVLGEKVYCRLATADWQLPTVIDVSSFAKGIYFIQLTTDDNIYSAKIIKE